MKIVSKMLEMLDYKADVKFDVDAQRYPKDGLVRLRSGTNRPSC
jgi:hypothetical protein